MSFGEQDEEILQEMESVLRQELSFQVRRLANCVPPARAFDVDRNQWGAVEFMKDLLKVRPGGAIRILGVTSCDLFIPMLSFLFGQAQLNGAAALVATARLRQEFYGLPPNSDLLKARVRKETLHELGHTLGLIHCPDRNCAMSLSTSLDQVDTKLDRYCPSCAHAAGVRLKSLNEEPI